MGPKHQAIFTDRGPRLLVTFETVAEVRARPDHLPLGFALTDAGGHSQLCLLGDGDTWFRDRRVYGYFDRLVDDGFFEDFDQVVFWGAGAGAYAACAFSVVAPGATVLAAQPLATLDPAIAGWDKRFPTSRRLSFTDRYGFAPDMIEAADRAFLFYDPERQDDAIHAGQFTRPNVTRIPMRHFGGDIAGDLQRMKLLPGFVDAALAGSLTAAAIHRGLRARRSYAPYLRNLLGVIEAHHQTLRLARVARALNDRFGGRRFLKTLNAAEARLKAEGRKLPARRSRETAAAQ